MLRSPFFYFQHSVQLMKAVRLESRNRQATRECIESASPFQPARLVPLGCDTSHTDLTVLNPSNRSLKKAPT
jgi:hypothetical protein